MEEFSTFPEFDSENNGNNNHEFDPHTDFAQFLEEARRHSSNKEVPERESGKKQQELNQEKKQSKKKPWKLTALFSFLKNTDKKTKQCSKQPSWGSHSRNPRHPGHVSSPVKGTGLGAAASSKQHRRPVSGPLTNLFHPKKREEMGEIPYVSLDELNKPHYDAKVYGPVYLVS